MLPTCVGMTPLLGLIQISVPTRVGMTLHLHVAFFMGHSILHMRGDDPVNGNKAEAVFPTRVGVPSSRPSCPTLAGRIPSRMDDFTLFDTDSSLYLTGRAGCGKTRLLGTWLISLTPDQRRTTLVTASTGIAAQNLGHKATTLHSALGVDGGITPDRMARKGAQTKSKHLHAMTTLVIDEAGMCRADLMDGLDRYLRALKHQPDRPYGGVRLILTGDAHQLPPVVTGMEGTAFGHSPNKVGVYRSEWFFDAPALNTMLRQHMMRVVTLDAHHRQADPDMVAALDDIRDYRYTSRVHQLGVQAAANPPRENAVILCARRRTMHAINKEHIDQLDGVPHVSDAILDDAMLTLIKDRGLKLDDSLWPLPRLVVWKPGMRVVMLANDPKHRWANGSTGVITDTTGTDGRGMPVVTFDATGVSAPISPVSMTIDRGVSVKDEDGAWRPASLHMGRVRQLPFQAGYALTIHRAQGMTLDAVRLELGDKPLFAAGQAYVALSRTRTLDGLSLNRPLTRADVEGSNGEGVRWGRDVRRFDAYHTA